ncbi:hypothetical protein [Streptomyces sp. NPDC050982]|uniref:hypothetical protein n=1 Tax=Streptomyces sp. NPDC050982 TaxID=3154746 RepID=UPI0033C83D67
MFRALSGPYALEVVRGIVDAADELGVDVVTGTTGRRSISRWLDECVALDAAGLIIVISMPAEDEQRRIVEQRLPVVLIDRSARRTGSWSTTPCRRTPPSH